MAARLKFSNGSRVEELDGLKVRGLVALEGVRGFKVSEILSSNVCSLLSSLLLSSLKPNFSILLSIFLISSFLATYNSHSSGLRSEEHTSELQSQSNLVC